MSKIKQSLEENKAAILEAVPAELHAEVEAHIAAATDEPVMSAEETVQAIKAECAANPDVDESAAAEALGTIEAPAPVERPDDAQLATEQAELLQAAEAMGPYTED